MAIPELDKCCCCSLKTGTIVIGVLEIIGALIAFIFGVVFAIQYGNDKNSDTTVLRAVMICVAIVGVIQLICCVLLILGAILSRPNFLLPWLILAILGLIGTVIQGFAGIFSGAPVGTIFLHLSISITNIMIGLYLLLVVHSFRQYLKRQRF